MKTNNGYSSRLLLQAIVALYICAAPVYTSIFITSADSFSTLWKAAVFVVLLGLCYSLGCIADYRPMINITNRKLGVIFELGSVLFTLIPVSDINSLLFNMMFTTGCFMRTYFLLLLLKTVQLVYDLYIFQDSARSIYIFSSYYELSAAQSIHLTREMLYSIKGWLHIYFFVGHRVWIWLEKHKSKYTFNDTCDQTCDVWQSSDLKCLHHLMNSDFKILRNLRWEIKTVAVKCQKLLQKFGIILYKVIICKPSKCLRNLTNEESNGILHFLHSKQGTSILLEVVNKASQETIETEMYSSHELKSKINRSQQTKTMMK